jgi:hypothetical protein
LGLSACPAQASLAGKSNAARMSATPTLRAARKGRALVDWGLGCMIFLDKTGLSPDWPIAIRAGELPSIFAMNL